MTETYAAGAAPAPLSPAAAHPARALPSQGVPTAAWAGIFAVGLLWGGSFLSLRVAVSEVPVLTLVAMRVGGAALVLWIYVLARGLPLPRRAGDWGVLTVLSFLGILMPFLLITWGQQHLTAGLAAILNASTAVFGVLIAAALFRDERLTRRRGLGVALGFSGVAVAMGPEALGSLDPTSMAQLALVCSSIFYALGAAWGRARLRGLDARVVAMATLTIAALVLWPLALWRDGPPSADWSGRAFLAIGYLAVMATALAYIIYYRVLAVAGAGNTSLVTLLVAPVAILLGALVLGETLHSRDYLGFALLALGLLILDGRIGAKRR